MADHLTISFNFDELKLFAKENKIPRRTVMKTNLELANLIIDKGYKEDDISKFLSNKQNKTAPPPKEKSKPAKPPVNRLTSVDSKLHIDVRRYDFSNFSVDDLRSFTVRNQIDVIGTGKEGNIVRADLITAYNKFWDEKPKPKDLNGYMKNQNFVFSFLKSNLKMNAEERARMLSRSVDCIFSADEGELSSEELNFINDEFNYMQRYSSIISLEHLNTIHAKFKTKYALALSKKDGIDTDIL